MAESTDTGPAFFTKATPEQWSYVLSQYKEVLKARAALRTKKGGPEELIRLDTWYQEQLPKIIQSRKPPHILHEELTQIVKWKLMRGKFRPRLMDLVRINTESAVLTASKKAFRRRPSELSQAITALTNLKGVGPATASAILAAAFPDDVPYMADESMLSTPGIEATDYTLAEYLNYAEHIKACSDRLRAADPDYHWTPHKVEMTLWTYYLARDMNLSVLDNMPHPSGKNHVKDTKSENGEVENGDHDGEANGAGKNDSASPMTRKETSEGNELPLEEDTNDSNADSGKENNDVADSTAEAVDGKKEDASSSEKTSSDEPPTKKICLEQ